MHAVRLFSHFPSSDINQSLLVVRLFCFAMETSRALSVTPSDVLELLKTSLVQNYRHDSSMPSPLQAVETMQVSLTVSELLKLGSSVVRDCLVHCAAPSASNCTLTSQLPSLKPMIQESSSVAIATLISTIVNEKLSHHQEPLSHLGHAEHSIKHELLENGEEAVKEEVDSDEDGDWYQFKTIPEDHDPDTLRKDVPPHILYFLRGVRCQLCGFISKAGNAVDRLVQHIKEKHPKKASAQFLSLVRQRNSFQKVLGRGIAYCTCSYCKIFGTARFHNGFYKMRRC